MLWTPDSHKILELLTYCTREMAKPASFSTVGTGGASKSSLSSSSILICSGYGIVVVLLFEVVVVVCLLSGKRWLEDESNEAFGIGAGGATNISVSLLGKRCDLLDDSCRLAFSRLCLRSFLEDDDLSFFDSFFEIQRRSESLLMS